MLEADHSVLMQNYYKNTSDPGARAGGVAGAGAGGPGRRAQRRRARAAAAVWRRRATRRARGTRHATRDTRHTRGTRHAAQRALLTRDAHGECAGSGRPGAARPGRRDGPGQALDLRVKRVQCLPFQIVYVELRGRAP